MLERQILELTRKAHTHCFTDRLAAEGDVADIVSLLCSDRVLYTTGNHVDVDGGFHIRRL